MAWLNGEKLKLRNLLYMLFILFTGTQGRNQGGG